MKRILLALTVAVPLVLGTAACAATFTLDGVEVSWVDTRPVLEGHRRWVHHGVAVYEVNGRYYREHQGRWVMYRERPRDLVEERR